MHVEAGIPGGTGQAREHDRVDRRPTGQDRPTSEPDISVLLLVHARMVGGVGDVHDDPDIRIQAVGTGARSTCRHVPDFLLDGGCRHGMRQATFLTSPSERIQHDDGAHPVVDRPRREKVVGKVEGVGLDHGHVADRDSFLRFIPAGRPDVDPQVLQFDRLVAFVAPDQVNRTAPHHSRHQAGLGQDLHSLADEHLGIPAADAAHPQIPLVIDVIDHEADLVDVSGEHDAWGSPGVDCGETVAVDVAPGLVRESRCLISPYGCGSRFESGRSAGIQEPIDQVSHFGFHRLLTVMSYTAGLVSSHGVGRACCEATGYRPERGWRVLPEGRISNVERGSTFLGSQHLADAIREPRPRFLSRPELMDVVEEQPLEIEVWITLAALLEVASHGVVLGGVEFSIQILVHPRERLLTGQFGLARPASVRRLRPTFAHLRYPISTA